MRKRTLVLLATVAALLSGAAQPAGAGDGRPSDENRALAVNTTDGASLFELAMSIRRTDEPEITPTNVAMAYAQCESCRTVAIAFQVVLAEAPTASVEASNTAVAVNDQCRSCETFAAAHQFVVVTGAPVRFTSEGRREVRSIRRELRSLRSLGLPLSELHDRVDRLALRLHQAVTSELRFARRDRSRASGSRLEAGLGGLHPRSPGHPERREARRHARHRPGSDRPARVVGSQLG